MKKVLLTMVVLAVLVSGCGIVGYESKTVAEYKTDALVVTLEKTSATQQEKQANMNIEVLDDPNGMLRLTYGVESREYAAASHSPEELAKQIPPILEALPASFWQGILDIVNGTDIVQPND